MMEAGKGKFAASCATVAVPVDMWDVWVMQDGE